MSRSGLLLVLFLAGETAPGIARERPEFPDGRGTEDLKEPYLLEAIEAERRKGLDIPNRGDIKVQFRVYKNQLYTVGQLFEFDRETETLRLLSHPEARFRKGAIDDLVRYSRSVRSARAITRLLPDPSMEVRGKAAEALGIMGYRSAVYPLIEALDYTTGPAKQLMARALFKLTGRDLGTHYQRWWTWYEENSQTVLDPGFKPVTPDKEKPRDPYPSAKPPAK